MKSQQWEEGWIKHSEGTKYLDHGQVKGILADYTREVGRCQIMQGIMNYGKDCYFYPKKSLKDCK